jgi:hypothetical protein
MTTELTNVEPIDGTTMAEQIDIDRLIDLMSDSQLDRLTMRQRRRSADRIKAAAAVAAIQAEQAAALNPTAEERERRFRANHEDIPSILSPKHNVTFYADGSEYYPISELAMPGSQPEVTQGGERGPLPQLRSIFQYWEALKDDAEQRLADVLQDTARHQANSTYYFAPPEVLQANRIEERRVRGSLAAIDGVMTPLLGAIEAVAGIERRTKDQGERNRQISEAISTVPAAAQWMSSATALWRSR